MCDWAGTQTIKQTHTYNEANNTDKRSEHIFNSLRTT